MIKFSVKVKTIDVLLFVGVVFNKKQLMNAAKKNDCFYSTTRYEEKGDVFFDELRGSFSRLLVDKRKNTPKRIVSRMQQ